MPRPRRFHIAAVLLALALLPGLAGGGEPVADHLKCFQIKDELGKTERRTVLATDLLPAHSPPFADATCKIRLPASHLCIEAAKTNVLERGSEPYEGLPIVGAPARKFLCYRMRCGREHVELEARDQFGGRVIQTKKGSFLCVPAEDASGTTPTPVVTPTATMTVAPAPTQTPERTATATVTPSASTTATLSATPTITASLTPNPTATVTSDPTGTVTVTPTPGPMPTMIPPTPTPTITVTATVTPTGTPAPTVTLTPIVIATPVPCTFPASDPTGGGGGACGNGICPPNLACLPDELTQECTCQEVPCGGPVPSGGVCSAVCPPSQVCVFDDGNCRCAGLDEVCGGDLVPPIPDGNGGQCGGLCIGIGMICVPFNVDGTDRCGCTIGAGGGETPPSP